MGAGVAASPHCPCALDPCLGGEDFSRREFSSCVSRTKARARFLRSPRNHAEARSKVSPLAPRQGRSPDGSPLGGFGTCVPLPCPGALMGPKPLKARPAGSSAEALVPPDMVMSRSPGPCLVRSSRAETRSCPTHPEPKSLLSRWQRACPKTPLLPGWSWLRRAGVLPDPFRRPEGRWSGAGSRPSRRKAGSGWALSEACRHRIR